MERDTRVSRTCHVTTCNDACARKPAHRSTCGRRGAKDRETGAIMANDGSLDMDRLQRAIDAAQVAGRARWPGIQLDRAAFASYVDRWFDCDAVATATEDRLADLYLVAGCGHMLPEALLAFDREYIARVPQFVRRINGGSGFGEEIAQLLRIKLFVGDGDTGKLTTFNGRGQLESWVCAVAIRTALSAIRSRTDAGLHVDPLGAGDAGELHDDPDPGWLELGVVTRVLLHQHSEEFRLAMREAMSRLSAADRNLLRYYYLEKLTLQQIGELRGSHASTVMRRLRELRSALAHDVRERLREKLGLASAELASVERDLVHYVDVSASTILAVSE